jgi:lipid-A-disaccharide synthase
LLKRTVADIRARRPDVVVTIDSPAFTLRVLRAVGPGGPSRIHYVAPQVWAWREGRVRRYPGLWDNLLCLLPFEAPFFARHNLPAHFVGHPVLESGADAGDADRFRAAHGLRGHERVLLVMPGSRRIEVRRLLPIFGATLRLLAERLPGLRPVIPVSAVVAEHVRAGTVDWPARPILVETLTDKHDAFAAASAGLIKSGTSSVEMAVAGVPHLIAYRVNPLTAAIVRRLVRVPYASLVNLLAEREVVPEYIQERAKPAALAGALDTLLTDMTAAQAQRAAFVDVLARLHPSGLAPSEAAADAVLSALRPA